MLNWAKLYSEGRCKAPGAAWNESELKARYELKIPADYVRIGILTKEDYELVKDKEVNVQKIQENALQEAGQELIEEVISSLPEEEKTEEIKTLEKKIGTKKKTTKK